MLLNLLKILILMIPILISVAFYTLMERKLLSLMGTRVGPNKVSFWGILQPIMDAMKLMNKQMSYLSNYSMMFYYMSSILVLIFSMILWTTLQSEPNVLMIKYSLIMLMIILSFNSLNSILAGWSTFSKYALIGSIRTVAQLISYELVMYLCIFTILIIYNTFHIFNFNYMPMMFLLLYIPFCFYSWIPSMLAELNRTPYDFSEGESELVSGFNVEFGSICFTMIFLAEYMNMIFFCSLTTYLFFLPSFYLIMIMLTFILWVRAVMPRMRFDNLMMMCWKFFVPYLSLMYIICMILI